MKLLDRIFRRRREGRSGLTNPEAWLVEALTGGKSSAGVSVTSASSLALSTYYDCLRVISEDVAKLPLVLYSRDGEMRERATSNPMYRLMHDSPNPEMSSMSFRETLQHHCLGWGNGYAEIETDSRGRAIALWPLDPSCMMVIRSDSGELLYSYNSADRRVVLPADRVVHLKGIGYSGVVGYSIAQFARDSIGGALAAQTHAAAFFGNGATFGGFLEHPGQLSDSAKEFLKKSVSEQHAGPQNAYKLGVLEEGMKYHQIGIPPQDAQFLETRQFQVEEVARWFRVPPHKVGHLLRATGWSTLEATNTDYLVDTLLPWLVRWEQELGRKLLGGSSELYYEHLVEGLLRADTKTRYDSYRIAVMSGWMSRNEVRLRENLNPVEGLDGYLQPLNVASVDDDGNVVLPEYEPAPANDDPKEQDDQGASEDADPETKEPDDSVRNIVLAQAPLLHDVFHRVVKLHNEKRQRLMRRGEFYEAAFYDEHRAHVAATVRPAIHAMLRSVDVVAGGRIETELDDRAAAAADRYIAWVSGRCYPSQRDTEEFVVRELQTFFGAPTCTSNAATA